MVFDKIDRFTRDASQKEVGIMSGLVQKDRVELHFPSDNLTITQDSPATDLFRLGIGMLLAKYYSDAARDNVKRRFEQMWRDGLYTNKAPFGYKHTRRFSNSSIKPIKGIAIDQKIAPLIVKAFEMRAQGISYQAIAQRLSELGLRARKSGRNISHSVMERTLSNKFYIGIMTCNGKEYPHKHPKIIAKELFAQCQVVNYKRQASKSKASYNSKLYAFKGVIKCGDCQRSISSYQVKNNTYLKCANPNCKNPNTSEALILPIIDQALKQLRLPFQTAKALRTSLNRKRSQEQLQMTQIKQQIGNINTQIDTLYDDRLIGRITTERYDRHIAKLENERQKLKNQANILISTPDTIKKTVSQMIYLCQNAHKIFKTASNSLKNSMLEILLSNLELKNKNLTFAPNFPCWRSGKFCLSETKNSKMPVWYSGRDSNPRPAG